MIKRVMIFVALLTVIALVLGACGDTATPATTTTAATTAATTTAATTTAATTTAATTTVAATTAPATTTAAATTAAMTAAATTTAAMTAAGTAGGATTAASAANDIPPYTGATVLQVPDAIKTQYASSLGNNVTNPQAGAFVTTDSSDQVKTFYQNYFSTNNWTDVSSVTSSLNGQLSAANGFALSFYKGQTIVVMLAVPSSAASALGFTDSSIPANGTLALFFSGEYNGAAAGGTSAATAGGAATTTAAMTTDTSGATTAASTDTSTPAATTAAASGSGSTVTVAAASDMTEVALPAGMTNVVAQSLPGGLSANPNIVVKAYTSNDDSSTVATAFDKQLTSSGWQSAIPGASGPQSSGSGMVGIYSQSGTDLIFLAGDPSQFTTPSSSGSGTGPTQDQLNQLKQLFGNSKSVVIVVSGTGLMNAIMQASGASGTPAATTTSAASTDTSTPTASS